MSRLLAWQRIGKDVGQSMTAEEAITAGGLDWTVEKRPVLFNGNTGATETFEGRFVTVRTDTDGALGVVGGNYTVLQNKTAFSFFDAMIAEKRAVYSRAGHVDGGARIWIMAKLPETVKIMGVDAVDSYVLIHNSHDGSSAVAMELMALRQVCSNGLKVLTQTAGFRFRHTSTMGQKVEQARSALNISVQTMEQFLEAADAMARKKLNAQIVEEFLKAIDLNKVADESTRRENQRMEVLRLIESGIGHQEPAIRNSLWTAVNAVTQYVDHKPGNDERRLSSMWFGHGADIKARAYEAAVKLSK